MFSLPRAKALYLGFLLVFAPTCVEAADRNCPLPGQKVGLSVKLYFGQSMANGSAIRAAEWGRFLAAFVTPRFPDGLTVYDAYGQWIDPKTHALSREHTKVVEILTPNKPSVSAAILDIAHSYRKMYHQQSVGVVTSQQCMLF